MSAIAVVALVLGVIAASCVFIAFVIGAWRAIDPAPDPHDYPSGVDHQRHRRNP